MHPLSLQVRVIKEVDSFSAILFANPTVNPVICATCDLAIDDCRCEPVLLTHDLLREMLAILPVYGPSIQGSFDFGFFDEIRVAFSTLSQQIGSHVSKENIRAILDVIVGLYQLCTSKTKMDVLAALYWFGRDLSLDKVYPWVDVLLPLDTHNPRIEGGFLEQAQMGFERLKELKTSVALNELFKLIAKVLINPVLGLTTCRDPEKLNVMALVCQYSAFAGTACILDSCMEMVAFLAKYGKAVYDSGSISPILFGLSSVDELHGQVNTIDTQVGCYMVDADSVNTSKL